MGEVFGDAWYWIALLHPKEQGHAQAVALSNKIRGRHIVTSEMVLTEVVSQFARSGKYWRQRSLEIVRKLAASPGITIVEQTHAQFDAALTEFERYSDKTVGVTDCSSFFLMRERGISEVLTNDRHFEQVGFVLLE